MDKTLGYYNERAREFVSGTVNVDFSRLQKAFSGYLREGDRVLDLGCGSGRDSRAFIDMGFSVVSVDGSVEVCRLAEEYVGAPVICSTFRDYEPEGNFDGIWACASLLHLPFDEIGEMMRKYASYLKRGGCFYASFKYGEFSGERNGRFFTDFTEERFHEILKEIPELVIDNEYITEDVRPEKTEKWLNVFMVKE